LLVSKIFALFELLLPNSWAINISVERGEMNHRDTENTEKAQRGGERAPFS